jgi:hypothetical protein
MPKIPLYNYQPQSTPTQNIRVDPGVRNAEFSAGARLGSAVAQVGEVIGHFAIKKQALVAEGIMANEQRLRMETAAQVQDHITKNPDKPETWETFEQSAWKQYETGREQRKQKEKWGTLVVQRDEQEFKDYKSRTAIQFQGLRTKAEIMQANSRLESGAQAALRAGDYEAFKGTIEKMDLFPADKERKIREGLEQGTYYLANNELDAIQELPPAQQVGAFQDYIAQLKEKGEDGKFNYLEFGEGGLSLGGRVQLESVANARIRAAQRAMDVNGRRIVGELRMGRATVKDIADAVKAGDMDEETARAMAPDVEIALGELQEKEANKQRIEDEREQAKKDRAEREIEKQSDTAERLLQRIENNENVSLREIERQVALGKIDSERGNELRARLEQRAAGEQSIRKGPFEILSDRLAGTFMQKLGGRQPSEKDYAKFASDIARSGLSQPSRLKLVDQLLQVKLADVADLEEEGGKWMDREISKPEAAVRKDLIQTMRNTLPALGDVNAGNLLFAQESKIRDFFEGAKGGTPGASEVKALREELTKEIHKSAGHELLTEAFDF